MKDAYLDILTASRPASRHPRMSLDNRAKIFAPFDALRGFNLAVLTKQQERQLVTQTELSDDQQDELQRTLSQLQVGDEVTVQYFQAEQTVGEFQLGSLHTASGAVTRIDNFAQTLHLAGQIVPLAAIEALTVQQAAPGVVALGVIG